MSEREKEAALAFARTKPIEWDDFLRVWLETHPEVEEPKPRKRRKE